MIYGFEDVGVVWSVAISEDDCRASAEMDAGFAGMMMSSVGLDDDGSDDSVSSDFLIGDGASDGGDDDAVDIGALVVGIVEDVDV